MNRLSFTFTIIIAISALTGCGVVGDETPALQSAFKGSFSLPLIVAANEEYLLDGPRQSSGMEAGLREPFIQYHEEMTVQVDSANISLFMEAINSDINNTLISNGAKELGQDGSSSPDSDDLTHFSFTYREGNLYGTIQVWGVRGSGTNYQLIVLITES